jgi:hypothetical protein
VVEVTVVNTHASICVRAVFIQQFPPIGVSSDCTEIVSFTIGYKLALSDPTLDPIRQYDFPVLLRCRKMSDVVFVAFVCPLSEPV